MSSSSGKTGASTKKMSRSRKTGLQFPVSRIERFLREDRYTDRIGQTCPVYLSAALEYLVVVELIELVGTVAHDTNTKRFFFALILFVNNVWCSDIGLRSFVNKEKCDFNQTY
ncbi:hypothetical protein K501DRAFT_278234 [Backusella circina FSU 941]|nr:hypothetical protein K501DRAFT_278234 [Backusella circina FSU 941]